MSKGFKELVQFPITLAPMVGLTHVSMREALYKFFPHDAEVLWPTEMLNSRKLPDQELGQTNETIKWESDRGLCPQILGNDKKYIQDSIISLKDWGAVAIDINMGCPVKKALKHNYGVSLMGDKEYAGLVTSYAVQASELPVSVKLRAGIQKDQRFLLDFCETLLNSGASWLTLHPRLASEKRKGKADWSQIKLLKDEFGCPIIGNGDIQTIEDIRKMREQTNCDAVMIGRAFCAKPWLATMYAKELGFNLTEEQQKLIPSNQREEALVFGNYLLDYINSCYRHFSPKDARKRVLFFSKVAVVWLNFGHSLYKIIHNEKTLEELREKVQRYFLNESVLMSSRTELRY